jgi:hypothetical protein
MVLVDERRCLASLRCRWMLRWLAQSSMKLAHGYRQAFGSDVGQEAYNHRKTGSS